MKRVKGPNGLVITFDDAVAEMLLSSTEHSVVEDEKAKPVKRATAKPADK